MALVSTGFQLTVNLIDTSNSSSTLSFDLQAADYATSVTDSATILAALANVTNSNVGGYRIVEVFEENAFSLPANAQNAEKAECAAFIAGAGTKKAIFRIPAPATAVFVSPSGDQANVVDTGGTEILAYAALFEAGGEAYISDGENIASPASNSLVSGKRITVKSRNP